MVKTIIINGSGKVGKDTFVSLCRNYHVKIFNISTVDKVKEAAKLLGWTGKKDEVSRKFLSDIKDLSTQYCNHPKAYIENYIKEVKNNYDNGIVFVHSREPEEIKWFKENISDCYTLLIKNNRVNEIKTNHADANVEKYNYDYIIQNNTSLVELDKKAEIFVFEVIDK